MLWNLPLTKIVKFKYLLWVCRSYSEDILFFLHHKALQWLLSALCYAHVFHDHAKWHIEILGVTITNKQGKIYEESV